MSSSPSELSIKMRSWISDHEQGAIAFDEIPDKVADTYELLGALIDSLQKLRPLVDETSDNYWGVCREDARQLCEIMGWNDSEELK